jgi:hydroxylamine dehydrogenase
MGTKKLILVVAGAACIFLSAFCYLFAGAEENLPLPMTGYHKRNVPIMGEAWSDAGAGYYDPRAYKPPKVPKEAEGNHDCVGCHIKLTGRAVEDWKQSKHGQNGVTCDECHGVHPDVKMPLPATCGGCHEKRLAQFNAGKHGRYGFTSHEKAGRRLTQYEEMKELGCGSCHNVQYKCDSCHTRHKFDLREAREPASCGTCHMGPDHAQKEYYDSSKHGAYFALEAKGYEEGGRVPTCVTCHMPKGNHDVSQGITIGGSSQGKFIGQNSTGDNYAMSPTGITMNSITKEEFIRERNKMVEVCKNCHSERFARHKLASSDAVKIASDAIAGEAIKVVRDLYKDGLLNPMPKDRPENPMGPGNQFPGEPLWLTGHQLYEQTSAIEAKLFRMYKFDLIHAWKGAYHFAPDWTHWYGNAPLKLSLSEILGEVNLLRRLNELEKKEGIKPVMPQIPGGK